MAQQAGEQSLPAEPILIAVPARNMVGWTLSLGSCVALLFGVLAGLQFSLRGKSLFELLVVLALSVGRLGILLNSRRSQ